MSVLESAQKTLTGKLRNIRYENPVVTKEMRSRMRGAKAYQIMLIYVLLMGIWLFGVYYSSWLSMSASTGTTQGWADTRLGYKMFTNLTWLQAILIALIAPSMTAGCLTIEREQQTIEILSLTTLSARNIIVGKLMSGFLFILMLLLCSLPLAGMCLMFGSISPSEIVVTYLILAAWAFLFSSIGVFFSSQLKKTAAASLAASCAVVVYGFATTMFAGYGYYEFPNYAPANSWSCVFGGLSGCMALDYSLSIAPVFHMKLPVALIGIILNVSFGILFTVLATTRLPFHRINRAAVIRGMILAISLIVLFLFIGNMLNLQPGSWAGDEQSFAASTFIIILIAVLPMVPMFSTGPIGPGTNPVKSLWQGSLWSKAFENRPAGGIFFLGLWWAAACAVIVAAFAYANGHVMAGSANHYSFDLINVMQVGLGLMGAILAWGVLGMLFSSLLPNRATAIALLVTVIILAWLVYPIMLWQHESDYNYTWNGQSGLNWQAAYLWPATALESMYDQVSSRNNEPKLWLDKSLAGVGCFAAWGIVAVTALLIAGKCYKNGRGIPDE